MKKIHNIIILSVFTLFLASCSVNAPLFVTDNPVGTKVGKASTKVFLGIMIGEHDASIATAAKNGGISKIATVDFKVKSGFLTMTYETIVTGE